MNKEEAIEYLRAFVESFKDGKNLKPEDLQAKGLTAENVGSILMFAYDNQQYDRDVLFRGIAESVEDVIKQEGDHISRNTEILRRTFRKACVLESSSERTRMIHQDAFDMLIFLEEKVGNFPLSERFGMLITAAKELAKRKGIEFPDDSHC